MIRKTLIPTDYNILLEVPESYIGKRIEILMFDTEEVNQQKIESSRPSKPSQLRGFLSKESAEAIQQKIEQSRNEWDTL